MKQICIIILCFLNIMNGLGQDPIEIIEEQIGDKEIKLFALSSLDEEIEITFNVELIGFTTKTSLPVIKNISKGVKIELISLNVTPNIECSYTTSLTYKKVKKSPGLPSNEVANDLSKKSRLTAIQLNPDKINIFTKDGCARCSFVKDYFDKNKIPYTELNTSIHHPNSDLMFEELGKSGFHGGTVTMPVVVYKGTVEHSIKDLQKFVEGFKK